LGPNADGTSPDANVRVTRAVFGYLPLPSDAGTAALFVSVTVAGNGLLGCTLALILLATAAAMEGQQLS
jgi:hypothetical protein